MENQQGTEVPDGVAGGEDNSDALGLGFLFKPSGEKVTAVKTRRNAFEYSSKHAHRGVCVIVNQKTFDSQTNVAERRGTDVDAENLKLTMWKLGFEVHVYKNQASGEVLGLIDKWRKYDHSRNDMFVMCFLSHGDRDVIYATNGQMHTEKLFTEFAGDKCRSLLGKPKIFFIQACRGDALDPGALADDRTDSDDSSFRIPAHADFLICYSTVPGFYSWRNTLNGSWFIQALCAVLRDKTLVETLDILSLMTEVNRRVALDFESSVIGNDEMDGRKQVPSITFTLTKLLSLAPKDHIIPSAVTATPKR